MVRKANSSTSKLKRVLFVPLSFLSIAIAVGIALILLSVKQNELLSYKEAVQQIADEFELIERSYTYILEEVITKREPIAESIILQTTASYEKLQPRIEKVSDHKSTTDNSLKILVGNRVSNLNVLRNLNSLIRAEYDTVNALDNYTSCKNAIRFNKTSTVILPQLENCTQFMLLAQETATKIPIFPDSNCQVNASPVFIVNKMADLHEKLLLFYQYSAKHKTKEAAAADAAYRAASTEASKLPKWNMCITDYLQTKSQLFE